MIIHPSYLISPKKTMARKRIRINKVAEQHRDWRTLPTDLLHEIHQRLYDNSANKFELHRMRSVCSSWRSCLLPLTSTTPLEFRPDIPPPPSFLNNDEYNYIDAFFSKSFVFLFPPRNQESGWIVKVEQRTESKTWHLENPLCPASASFEYSKLLEGFVDIVDSRVKEINKSYLLEFTELYNGDKSNVRSKAVIIWNKSKHNDNDFTILALFGDYHLGLWKPGEADWSEILVPFPIGDRCITDIIAFKDKFYATTMEGMLIMIDPMTYEVKCVITVEIEANYSYAISRLVESNGQLYLIYKEGHYESCEPEPPAEVRVFVLNHLNAANGKQSDIVSWKVVNNLEDNVFFSGEYMSFSIPAKDLGWSEGNCVLLPFEDGCCREYNQFFCEVENFKKYKLGNYPSYKLYFGDCIAVYSLQDSTISFGREKIGQFNKIFWPPPDGLIQQH